MGHGAAGNDGEVLRALGEALEREIAAYDRGHDRTRLSRPRSDWSLLLRLALAALQAAKPRDSLAEALALTPDAIDALIEPFAAQGLVGDFGTALAAPNQRGFDLIVGQLLAAGRLDPPDIRPQSTRAA